MRQIDFSSERHMEVGEGSVEFSIDYPKERRCEECGLGMTLLTETVRYGAYDCTVVWFKCAKCEIEMERCIVEKRLIKKPRWPSYDHHGPGFGNSQAGWRFQSRNRK
jgi:hypothetical protein